MLKSSSEQFKAVFLLNFTKELIRHSHQGELLALQTEVEEKEFAKERMQMQVPQQDFEIKDFEKLKELESQKVEVKKEVVQEKPFSEKKKLRTFEMKAPLLKQPRPAAQPKQLQVPEPKFPQELAYLKPVPTATELELKKLQSLINDPLVQSIECSGADEKIIVHGNMGTKPTNITLSKEEINSVLEEFSKKSRIPIQEGVFKVAVGRLILSAVVSNVVSSKFIIKKMVYNPFQQMRR